MDAVEARWPVVALGTAVTIWATTFSVSADALSTVSPAVLTVLRFTLAAAALVPLALRRGDLAVVLGRPVVAVLGLSGVAAYYGLQNLGLLYTTAGTAALLQAALPVATAALAALVLRERVPRPVLAGLVLTTTGVALVSTAGARLDGGGAIIIAGVGAYALYTVLLRRLGSSEGRSAESALDPPIVLAAATAIWGVIFLVPWLMWEVADGRARLPATTGSWGAAVYLGLVASGGTLVLWTYGARRVPAALSGVFTAAVPALGYVFALAVGEQPTTAGTIGGIVAVIGVVWAATASRPARGEGPGGVSTRS